MPGVITTDIDGAAEMERLLNELGPQVASKIGDQALRAGGKPILAEMKRLAPRDTGALAESPTSAIERRRKDEVERVLIIGFLKPVSRRVHLTEYGTANAPAQPFARPALDNKAGEALNEMGRVMANGLNREAEKLAK